MQEATHIIASASNTAELRFVQMTYAEEEHVIRQSGMKPSIASLIAPTERLDAEHLGPTTIEVFAIYFAKMLAK